MKKNKVDKILFKQAKIRKRAISYACLIFVIIILSLFILFLYFNNSKDVYVKYNESSSIDYKVFLKENNFWKKKYLEKNNSYIASLIDYINANFNYNISLQDDGGDFKYSYRVEAEVNVKEKDGITSLYNFREEILKPNEKFSYGNNSININENISIDYNRYNDLIKSFVDVYNLDNTVSTLTLRMYVNVIGMCENFENNKNESSMSIEIPLTTKTINIQISNDLIESENNILACNKTNKLHIVYLLIGILLLLSSSVATVFLIIYVVKSRTAEDIYQKELKKILNNYHSYIQKINNDFDISKYEKLIVDSFNDMLEIRDTVQQPILMVENKDQKCVYFIIPSNTNILYIYGLKLSDIKKRIEDK